MLGVFGWESKKVAVESNPSKVIESRYEVNMNNCDELNTRQMLGAHPIFDKGPLLTRTFRISLLNRIPISHDMRQAYSSFGTLGQGIRLRILSVRPEKKMELWVGRFSPFATWLTAGTLVFQLRTINL
jgi:hypothetical protein